MKKYSYTAINPEGSKLNGVIESDNENEARDMLNKMDFSVLDLFALTDEEEKAAFEKTVRFEFEAIDKSGKKVKGTIDAGSKYQAFKRLLSEYHFEIESICKSAQTQEEKDEEKRAGVLDLFAKYKKDNPDQNNTVEKKKSLEKSEGAYLTEQIKFVLNKIDELLNTFAGAIKPDEYNKITKKRDKLLRLKSSANISYIEHISEELIKDIQNPEIYLPGTNKDKIELFNIDLKKVLTDMQMSKSSKVVEEKILDYIAKWKSENIENTDSPSLGSKILLSIFNIVEDGLKIDPKLLSLKKQLKIVNEKIHEYKKILKTEISEEIITEVQSSIDLLEAEKEKLKNEITSYKTDKEKEDSEQGTEPWYTQATDQIYTFTSFLLFIYIGYYIISEFLASKFESVSRSSFTLLQQSPSFHLILAVVFYSWVILALRNYFFRKNTTGLIISFLSIAAGIFLILLNF